MVKLLSTLALTSLVTVAATPNWVGPKVGRPVDAACYRKTLRASECPLGYNSDKLGGCWAQCPVEYPVECGMECLAQSKDCTLEIITKISVVADVVLKAATSSVFSNLLGINGQVQTGIKCGVGLFNAVQKVVLAAGEMQALHPDITTDKLILELLQSSPVLNDLTGAIVTCTGAPSAVSDVAIAAIKFIVEQVAKKGSSVLAPDAFVALTAQTGIGSSIVQLQPTDMAKFKQLIAGGNTGTATCGWSLKTVLDQIIQLIINIKKVNPKATPEAIRLQLGKTDLFMNTIPALTNDCSGSTTPEAFDLRELIRKTLQTLIDKVVDAAYQNGNPVPIETYAIVAANLGLEAIATIDPTGLANLAKEFVQPICGPTTMMGEIDDGSANLALGLLTMDRAFNGSYGSWTKAGNGQVQIFFESADTQDVKVDVMSGGQKIDSVAVGKGQSVAWTKPIKDLQDKTLYLDRWRPGIFGLPGKGGGSLVAWIPHAADGGHFELHAKLNVS
ncbi:hypothetical protein Poli38472_014422 [Pythium oligandrum]|uniref:Uncharacterized protein n=1 Tax=Pythium oligandrum TaxID=41045 RepID=A0A8K1C729_PYTOL|nr:hypothetical protein Poli38472_014422 [Pythium oligandrum]|eukprot:TMW57819.1 hypothetical protein Poli38472_014422 [Pythium oligandrum]